MTTASTPATTNAGPTPASGSNEKPARAAIPTEKKETIAPAMDSKLRAAHSVVTRYMEDQAGAVKDWKSPDRNTKNPGHVWYLAEKGTPTIAICPDLAVDVKARVKIPNVSGSAAVLQDPIKAGSVLQLPGGILTKALAFVIDLKKNNPSLQVVMGWPSKEGLAEGDLIEGYDEVGCWGTKATLDLPNGDIGLLVAVSFHGPPFPRASRLMQPLPCLQDYPCVIGESVPIVSLDEDAPEVKNWLNEGILGETVHQELLTGIAMFDSMSQGVEAKLGEALWEGGRLMHNNNRFLIGHGRIQKVLINIPANTKKNVHLYKLTEYFGVKKLQAGKPPLPSLDMGSFVMPASMNRFLYFEVNPVGVKPSSDGAQQPAPSRGGWGVKCSHASFVCLRSALDDA